MKVCAVTCTGARPELFSLCKKWVARQTLQPDLWIVVTDNGEEITDLPANAVWHAVEPWRGEVKNPDWAPNHTLSMALRLVPRGHATIVFEDDDWYSPKHIEKCVAKIKDGHSVVYGAQWVRYHVPLCRWSVKEKPVPGEGRVGIAPSALRRYRASLLDRPLYSGCSDGRYPFYSSVGIKGVGYGLPGRTGATPMHNSSCLIWRHDPNYKIFRKALGQDAEDYIRLVSLPHEPSSTASVL